MSSSLNFLPPNINVITPYKFDYNNYYQKILARYHLDKYGYVVYSKAASSEECNEMRNKQWKYIEDCTKGEILRNDIKTWDKTEWPALRNAGLLQYEGVGQSPGNWQARQLPSIRIINESLYGTSELLTSFDGTGIFKNCLTKTNSFKKWWHTDQNLNLIPAPELLDEIDDDFFQDLTFERINEIPIPLPSNCTVQGILHLIESDPVYTGGFCCIPKSHRKYMEEVEATQKHPLGLDDRGNKRGIDLEEWDSLLEENGIALKLDEGDFVLFYSFLAHQNHHPLKSAYHKRTLPEKFRNQEVRMVIYICIAPFDTNDKNERNKIIKSRIEAVKNGYTTTHEPNVIAVNAKSKIGFKVNKIKEELMTPEYCKIQKVNKLCYALITGTDPSKLNKEEYEL